MGEHVLFPAVLLDTALEPQPLAAVSVFIEIYRTSPVSTLQLDVKGNWLCCLLEIAVSCICCFCWKRMSRKRLAVGLKPAVFTAWGPTSFSVLLFSRN